MNRFYRHLTAFVQEEAGSAEASQVGVILALIVLVVLAGLNSMGNGLNKQNNATSNMLKNATSTTSSS